MSVLVRPPCEHPIIKGAPARAPRGVLISAILGSSLGFIDSTVINVALPAIQKDLNADFATGQWVANGYMLALASLMIVGGNLADKLGRKKIFILGLLAFALTSLGCAVATTPGILVLLRVLQGLSATLMLPTSLALIGAAYTGEARTRAIGIWTAASALATSLGPPLGGYLVDTFGWRAIFLLNVPLALIAVGTSLRIATDALGKAQGTKIDILGAGAITLTLGLISFGLVQVGEGNTNLGSFLTVAALPTAFLFYQIERSVDHPMIPLDLFKSIDFKYSNLMTFFFYASMIGALFFVPYVLVIAHGYSALAAGAAFTPFAIIMAAGSPLVASLSKIVDGKFLVAIGPVISAVGYGLLAVSGQDPAYFTGYFPGICVISIGATIAVTPLTTIVLNAVPDEQNGIASAVNNVAARVGGLLAVAALGLAFSGSSVSTLTPASLLEAYRMTMWIAIAAALLSSSLILPMLRRAR